MSAFVRTFAEFCARESLKARARAHARDLALRVLSLGKRQSGGEWIRFPFWHHVFDDERQGFARQLAWMKRQGDFIGFSDAVNLLASGDKIGGRYFCLSFDDGFKNVFTNAAPILDQAGAKAMVYLATAYVGETNAAKLRDFYDHGQLLIEFMDWQDAKAWQAQGHEVGSHTRSHAHLIDLDEKDAMSELSESKRDIEERLGVPCRHFGCPWGGPDQDFLTNRDPKLARKAGYASFATTARGVNRSGDDVCALRRDHLLANWGDHQLRYFLAGG